MAEHDTYTIQQIVMLAVDAGVEYLRVGDIEVRFPPRTPEVASQSVPAGERGRVVDVTADGDKVDADTEKPTGYHELFGGKMPSFKGV